jgi:hypothetical protein
MEPPTLEQDLKRTKKQVRMTCCLFRLHGRFLLQLEQAFALPTFLLFFLSSAIAYAKACDDKTPQEDPLSTYFGLFF